MTAGTNIIPNVMLREVVIAEFVSCPSADMNMNTTSREEIKVKSSGNIICFKYLSIRRLSDAGSLNAKGKCKIYTSLLIG